jgi:hypothetical protein
MVPERVGAFRSSPPPLPGKGQSCQEPNVIVFFDCHTRGGCVPVRQSGPCGGVVLSGCGDSDGGKVFSARKIHFGGFLWGDSFVPPLLATKNPSRRNLSPPHMCHMGP